MKTILIVLLLIIGILIVKNGVKRLLGKLGNPNEIMEKMHTPYVTEETAFYIIKMLSTLITLVTYFAILILLFFLVHLGVNETSSIIITFLVVVITIDTLSGWIPIRKYKEPEEYFTRVLTGRGSKIVALQGILFGSIYIAVAIVFIFTL